MASSAIRSVLRTRAVLPIASRAARQSCVPIFSMQARHMSIPRPTWDIELKDLDPEVYKIIQLEQERQHKGIALIPSENYTSESSANSAGEEESSSASEKPFLAFYFAMVASVLVVYN